MKKLEALFLTGRTVWQGEGMESGKEGELYTKACCMLEMNPEDMKKIHVNENESVLVYNDYGKVVMKAVKAKEELPEGMVYAAYGSWANVVVCPDTNSTGMPYLKAIKVTIKPVTQELANNSLDLVEKTYMSKI
ncbi:molybdopterin dinucleotide binding domain-containing protein [Methanococcus maripaludis]|jgi:formylmethanofuran dehydrogenase subunit D|uniref:Tungsten formylmethanofuran dehydrogenase subunit D n=1 Tax=Methanococcus maripaludis KA1 TaxID=637914 RepID=A0A2Z5PFW2_METMI|nr:MULTISPECIES: molybdopterin dinucleotide binding domain-containing protein [Methanococcaceae]BAP61213.1 tungsten formylmethanofuran dehydrogenase subunit D [Methanococcus maripaludis KA1]